MFSRLSFEAKENRLIAARVDLEYHAAAQRLRAIRRPASMSRTVKIARSIQQDTSIRIRAVRTTEIMEHCLVTAWIELENDAAAIDAPVARRASAFCGSIEIAGRIPDQS